MFSRNDISRILKIGNFRISNKSRCMIVAELSANHSGKINNVFKAIDIIKKIGVDAIKIQSYEPETITLNSKNKYFYINDKSIWKGKYLYELYKSTHTPFSWHKRIFEYAKKKKLLCFSSPFDKTAVDLLEKCNCPCYKIASPEITDLKLIDFVAKKNKPIIISTGIANEKDIKLAINQCLKNKNSKIALLNCISSYPADDNELNLSYINKLKKFVNVVGYSDHSKDDLACLVSVVLGAKIVEKHFKIDDATLTSDSSFSIATDKFKNLVLKIRRIEKMLGSENINKKKIIKNKLKTVTRSLFFVRDLKKGDTINEKDIRSVRPGLGLSPQKYFKILGKKVKKNAKKNTPVNKEYF